MEAHCQVVSPKNNQKGTYKPSFLIFQNVVRPTVNGGEMGRFLRFFLILRADMICVKKEFTDLLHLRLPFDDPYKYFDLV